MGVLRGRAWGSGASDAASVLVRISSTESPRRLMHQMSCQGMNLGMVCTVPGSASSTWGTLSSLHAKLASQRLKIVIPAAAKLALYVQDEAVFREGRHGERRQENPSDCAPIYLPLPVDRLIILRQSVPAISVDNIQHPKPLAPAFQV